MNSTLDQTEQIFAAIEADLAALEAAWNESVHSLDPASQRVLLERLQEFEKSATPRSRPR